MWRSIATRSSSFTRKFGRKSFSSQTPSQVIPKSLNSSLIYSTSSFKDHNHNQNPRKISPQNHRFFSHSSSITEVESETHDSTSSEEVESEVSGVFDDTHDVNSLKDFELIAEFDGVNENSDTQITDISPNDGINEIDDEKLKNVVSLLQSSVDGSLESSFDNMGLSLSEEFVVRVFRTPLVPGDHLIRFFKWGLGRNDFKVTSLVLSEFARAVCDVAEPKRMDVYGLWDLVREVGEKESGVVSAEVLNQLISAFSKLGKGKAAFEVFGKFEEFECVPNVDSYYLTLEVLCRRLFYDWAAIVFQKMLGAGMVPESKKVGEIISLYCKGHRSKEAHVIYLAAKEQKIYPTQKAVNFLISCLSKTDETLSLAQGMLEDIPAEVRKHSINPFTWVIRGLCRIKETESAKKLLAEMMAKGPPPGKPVFNLIINSLSKAGDLEDAKEMLNLIESRGLKPDVFTYSVIISGYVKGGMMEDACKVLAMAKKKHPKLCPATFHTLIRGYCNLGEFDKAVTLLGEMKKYGVEPNVDEYNKLIQSLCLKHLDWKTAEKLLEEMKEKGLYLPGITRGLINAVKELEQEAIESEEAPAKA